MQPTPRNTANTGPSRDMFGGPWLGVLVFVVVAIGLGWGLISLFEQRLESSVRDAAEGELAHGFDFDAEYTLKHDLLLGYLADGRVALFPGKNDLPRGAPGRRQAATIEAYRQSPGEYPDLIGLVGRNTRVRFTDVIEDRDNPQTRILVRVELLDGPQARKQPVLGMHLESTDTDQETGQMRAIPRPDLFAPVEPPPGPVQSGAPDPKP